MANKVNTDIFKHATAIRDSITKEQQEYIKGLYSQWSADIIDKCDDAKFSDAPSSALTAQYYNVLYKQIKAQSKEISNAIYTNIKDGMAKVSDAVVKDAVDWMSTFGFSKKGLDGALSYIPQSTVNALVTGSVYGGAGSWNLSSAIWGDNEKTLRDIYAIMGQGIAEQMPIQQIAQKLSQYVSPTKQLQWSGPNGLKIYKKAVDYNAQRLARTLVQHTYQQSFVAATKDNPFVTEYVWLSNGPRVCQICAMRDGQHFKKDKLPLDHPNGMCVMEPVVTDNLVDQLANWVNSPDGTYPEIDAYAKKFGYDASKMPKLTLADIKKQYGNAQYKAPNAWFKQLPKDVQDTVSKIHQASGKKWTQWYQDEIMDPALKKTVKSTAKKAAAKTTAKAKESLSTMSDMIEKYSMKLGQSSSGFNYLGKMSTNNMLDMLKDDEIDDIAAWMQKVHGLDISTGSKKDKAVVQWIEDAFSDIDKMNYDEKLHLKDVANGIAKASGNGKANFSNAIKTNNKVTSVFNKWIDEMKAASGSSSAYKKTQEWIRYMKSIESEFKSKLTRNSVSAIKTYSGSAYQEINAWLRSGKSMTYAHDYGVSDSLASKIKGLIKEWNSSSMKTTEDYIVRRGTDLGDLAGLFMDGNFSDNVASLRDKSVEELANMFTGQSGEYKGFTSTSSMYDRGFRGNVECIIKVPKGSSGMSILSISRYGDSEGEFLLNAGTKVICKGIEASDGHMGSRIRVYLEVLV